MEIPTKLSQVRFEAIGYFIFTVSEGHIPSQTNVDDAVENAICAIDPWRNSKAQATEPQVLDTELSHYDGRPQLKALVVLPESVGMGQVMAFTSYIRSIAEEIARRGVRYVDSIEHGVRLETCSAPIKLK